MTTITLAKSAGFCFGVRRAIDIAEQLARTQRAYTLGPIIHNPQMVAQLATRSSMQHARS